MALPSMPEEREYGAVQEDEQLTAGAPPSLEPSPAEADEQAMKEVEETVEEATQPQEEEQKQEQEPQSAEERTPEQPQEMQPNVWRVPPRYDRVLGTEAVKPALQAYEDMGLLWDALASSPNVDPLVRAIARSLRGEG